MPENSKGMSSETIIDITLKYFFYDLKVRSQTQHIDLVNDFKSFAACYPALLPKYEKKLNEIKKRPIEYFMKNNPDYFSKDQRRKIDSDFSLASLDFLYFRDTSFANQLKTTYLITYKRPTRQNRALTLYELLDVMAYIRGILYEDTVEIARQMQVIIPLILPAVERKTYEGVGLETK